MMLRLLRDRYLESFYWWTYSVPNYLGENVSKIINKIRWWLIHIIAGESPVLLNVEFGSVVSIYTKKDVAGICSHCTFAPGSKLNNSEIKAAK